MSGNRSARVYKSLKLKKTITN